MRGPKSPAEALTLLAAGGGGEAKVLAASADVPDIEVDHLEHPSSSCRSVPRASARVAPSPDPRPSPMQWRARWPPSAR